MSILLLFSVLFFQQVCNASELYFPRNLSVDTHDTASLQRGAQLYLNYCSGCHSLRYERYNNIAAAIGVENAQHQVYTDLVQKMMLFTAQGNIAQKVETSMPEKEASYWFGVAPPDLTNITLVHSPAWLYNFLRGFYRDEARATGANNVIAPNTAMPNVLLPLRGETMVVWNNGHVDRMITVQAGRLPSLSFDRAMLDLVNFLTVVSEPYRPAQYLLGVLALAFLAILFIIVYFLYRCQQADTKA